MIALVVVMCIIVGSFTGCILLLLMPLYEYYDTFHRGRRKQGGKYGEK